MNCKKILVRRSLRIILSNPLLKAGSAVRSDQFTEGSSSLALKISKGEGGGVCFIFLYIYITVYIKNIYRYSYISIHFNTLYSNA